MFSIVISEKGGAERRETFDQDAVTIGRVQGNDLMLPKGNVSKRHCRIERQGGRFVVRDQESTNGTYVNRRRITSATVVREGDRIYVGDFILRIEPGDGEVTLDPEPISEAMLEPPRAPMLTSPDVERPSQAGPVTGQRPTSDATIKLAREHDGGIELHSLVAAATALARRVASNLEPRVLDRDVDAALERRVERLIEDAFNELVIEGEIPSGADEARIKSAVQAELTKFGPLESLMEDVSVQEVAVTGPGHIAVQRARRVSSKELPFFLPESLPRVAARLCKSAGVIAPPSGVAHIVLHKFGMELHLLGSDVMSQSIGLRLSRPESFSSSMDDLVRMGVISRTMATFLRHCLNAHVNILVVGPVRSGASEVLSALASGAEGDRVLGLPPVESPGRVYPNVVWLDVPAEGMTEVLRSSASFVSHRILVDGLSVERAVGTLSAIAEGAQGTLVRMKARNIERGLSRLCANISLELPGVTPFVAAEAFVAGFDIAIEVARLPDGRSRVIRIAELERGEEALIQANDIFDFAIERTATGGSIEGTFRNTGHVPNIAAELKNHGTSLEVSLMSRPPTSDDRAKPA